MNLPKISKENYTQFTKLIDSALQHIESLNTLNVVLPSELIVQLLEQKLDPSTLDLWDKNTQSDDFPTIEEMTDFIYKTAARLSRRNREKPALNNQDIKNPKIQKVDFKKRSQVFVTTERKCIACSSGSHPLFKCDEFLKMSINERIELVKKASLCNNCLRFHKDKCKFGDCKICSKKHNTLLCRSTTTIIKSPEA